MSLIDDRMFKPGPVKKLAAYSIDISSSSNFFLREIEKKKIGISDKNETLNVHCVLTL